MADTGLRSCKKICSEMRKGLGMPFSHALDGPMIFKVI